MLDSEIAQAEAACAKLVAQYTLSLDEGDAAAVAGLFAADGVWRRQGKDLAGRAAITSAILAREKNVVIRHHLSNVVITVESAEEASGRSYYALYRSEVGDAPLPLEIDGPERCGDNFYRFKRADGVWRLSRTEAVPTFRRAGK